MVKTRELIEKAKKYFPGGVNSPVRSFRAVGMKPIFVKSGKGSKICTNDGKKYIDYCMSWGTLMFGHSDNEILKAVRKQLALGTSYGFTNIFETELAEKICNAIPSMEMIRFVNSGTEATTSAVRLAFRYTGRSKILKFTGCYHGASELFFDRKNYFEIPYNDLSSASSVIKKHYKEIACVIVEPIAGNMGVILPEKDFLAGLRVICDKYKIILIFDEVINGFRITFGSAQSFFRVKPDLTCLGKIIGGGFPVGAFGGKKEIMKKIAPSGNVYQAGTFSGNPITMVAGITTIKKLQITTEGSPCGTDYKLINDRTKCLCNSIKNEAKKNNVDIVINQIGSMFSLFFTKERVINYASAKRQDVKKFKRFYSLIFKQGILFSPSSFESNFISFAHTDKDIEKTVSEVSHIFGRL
ncbi:MAG: glutamate-1-semialdehyde 2,1-aminomutase [Elusimicrobia bacterium]|nr:glutamate-1-semialdehyde 2,1-aminomutase [Elusimicrobiota bacterium]